MRKIFLLIVPLLLLVLLLSACGKSPYAGEWVLYSAESTDGTLHAGAYGYDQASISLHDDGTGLIVVEHAGANDGQSDPITWEEYDGYAELVGNTYAWTASLNEDILDVNPYGDPSYSRLHFVTKKSMDAAEENADRYYSAVSGNECFFLSNGLYHESDTYLLFQKDGNDYLLDTVSSEDNSIETITLTYTADGEYGEALLLDGELWAAKDEAIAKEYFDSHNGRYVGTWNAVSLNFQGDEMTPDQVSLQFTLVVSEDGTLAATTNGQEDGTGMWIIQDNGIRISDSTGSEMSGYLEGDNLVVDFGYGYIVTLEKE